MPSPAQLRQLVGDDTPPYELTDEDIGRAAGTANAHFYLTAVLLRELLESRSGESLGKAWAEQTKYLRSRYSREVAANDITMLDGDTSMDIDTDWVIHQIDRQVEDWAETAHPSIHIPADKLVNAPGASEAEIDALIKAYVEGKGLVDQVQLHDVSVELSSRDAGTSRFPYVRNAGVVDLNQLTGAGEFQVKDNARVLNYPSDLPHSGSDFLTSDDDLYVIVRRMGEQSGVEIIHQQLRTDFSPTFTWDRFADATGHWSEWVRRDTRAVADWATSGNTAVIPAGKLPTTARGLSRQAVDNRIENSGLLVHNGDLDLAVTGGSFTQTFASVANRLWLVDDADVNLSFSEGSPPAGWQFWVFAARGEDIPVSAVTGLTVSANADTTVVEQGVPTEGIQGGTLARVYRIDDTTFGLERLLPAPAAQTPVDWAREGNTDLVPADKLPGSHSSAGLTQAQVDARVRAVAAGALPLHGTLTDKNLDNAIVTGWFLTPSGVTNGPTGASSQACALQVDTIATGAIQTIQWVDITNNLPVIWHRTQDGSTWGDWHRLADGSGSHTAASGTLPNPKLLPNNTDLNDVHAPGWYVQWDDPTGASAANFPNNPALSPGGESLTGVSGVLFVSPEARRNYDNFDFTQEQIWYWRGRKFRREYNWNPDTVRAEWGDWVDVEAVSGGGIAANAIYGWALKANPNELIDASKLTLGTQAWARPGDDALIPAGKLPIGFQEEDVVGLSVERNYLYDNAPSGPREGRGGIIFTYHDTNGRILYRGQSGSSSLSLIQDAPAGWSALIWVGGPTPVTIGTGPSISITFTRHTETGGQAAALPGYISKITRTGPSAFRIAALHKFEEIPDTPPVPEASDVKVGTIWTGGPAHEIGLSSIYTELVRLINTSRYDTLRFRFAATSGRTESRTVNASQYVDFDITDLQSGSVTLSGTDIQWIQPIVVGPNSNPQAGICWLVLNNTTGTLHFGGDGTKGAGNWHAHLLRTRA